MTAHRYARFGASGARDADAECDPKVVFRLRRRRILDGAKDRMDQGAADEVAQVWEAPPAAGILPTAPGVVQQDPVLRAAVMSGELIDERLYGIGRHAPGYVDPAPLVLTGEMRAASGHRR